MVRFPPLALLVLLLPVLVSACGVQGSNVDAKSSVTVAGKAIGQDGKPLAGTRVVLVKELDLGEVAGGLFLTAASLGVACLADHPPAICAENARTATTGADGAYSFNVKGADTQGSFGLASTMEVVVRAPARASESSGAVSTAEFQVQTAALELPDLRVWQPDVRWDGGRAAWPALPRIYGESPSYSVEVHDAAGNEWWATEAGTRSGEALDPRILEDVDGSIDVAARARGTASGTTVDFTYVSGSRSIRGTAGPPPSRNALCAPVTATGPGALAACPVTGGLVARPGLTVAGATGVAVDLGSARRVSFLVARGCSAGCTIAISLDGATWTDVARVSRRYATATIAAQDARYVRITTSDVSAIRQLSIW
jgi:hypothetical protein